MNTDILPARLRAPLQGVWKTAGSLEFAIAALVLLMADVVLCTLDQVPLGTFQAVQRDIRSLFIWWSPQRGLPLPVFPGGGLVGFMLLAGLVVNFVDRFRWEWRKSGILLAHTGLVLLVLGEFMTGFFAVETQMAIEEGQTANYTENGREMELALVDAGDPKTDTVFAVPESLLAPGRELSLPVWPFRLVVREFHHNSTLSRLGPGEKGAATMGVGASLSVRSAPPPSTDESPVTSAVVEVLEQGAPRGTWLVSNGLGAPQAFVSEGRTYRFEMRPRRRYLPYAITLKDFRREMYPGTDVPKSFSSLVRLDDPARGESRDVLIYMNNPLRYGGKAFYQASFGKDDKLSVLQVVDNPGWLIPYAACLLVGAGLLVQFLNTFSRSAGARP